MAKLCAVGGLKGNRQTLAVASGVAVLSSQCKALTQLGNKSDNMARALGLPLWGLGDGPNETAVWSGKIHLKSGKTHVPPCDFGWSGPRVVPYDAQVLRMDLRLSPASILSVKFFLCP